MILGVGIDILDISRMERPMQSRRFRERVFTANELKYLSGRGIESAAGVFCAKEAVAKAMGIGIFEALKTVEITHTPAGQPMVARPAGFFLSVTHSKSTAAAVAIWSE